MNILITSGGTSEKIDQVRSITNHSTGQLGKIISKRFLEAGFSVTLVTTPTAVQPKEHPHLRKIFIKDVAELQTVLEKETPTHQVLIHAMAVSDYSPVYMSGFQAVKEASNLEHFLHQTNQESKISSEEDYQVLFLYLDQDVIVYLVVVMAHAQITRADTDQLGQSNPLLSHFLGFGARGACRDAQRSLFTFRNSFP